MSDHIVEEQVSSESACNEPFEEDPKITEWCHCGTRVLITEALSCETCLKPWQYHETAKLILCQWCAYNQHQEKGHYVLLHTVLQDKIRLRKKARAAIESYDDQKLQEEIAKLVKKHKEKSKKSISDLMEKLDPVCTSAMVEVLESRLDLEISSNDAADGHILDAIKQRI